MVTVKLTIPAKGKENKKVGPIPVSTTSNDSCPDACPLKSNGCYAEGGPLGIVWRKMQFATGWEAFCEKIAALPVGGLWRHNQAGDLPHNGQHIDAAAMQTLITANTGKRGFTYTHHNPAIGSNGATIAACNAGGFTVNLSANNLEHADKLAELEIAPVVVVLPATINGNAKLETPAGRRVVVCPATYRDNVSCATCGLCAVATRKTVVGFPAHGASSRKASAVAAG